MNTIFKKLRSRAGESLVETLCAILIFTLASLAMYTMVTAAADINMTAKETDQAIQQQLEVAERADVSSGTGTVKMYIEVGSSEKVVSTVTVDIYGAEGDLYSYFAKEVAGG